MPELPEVETTLRGITPHIAKQHVETIIIRNGRLRWPVPKRLAAILRGKKLLQVTRRNKYLLFHFSVGTLIVHLGMSGKLRVLKEPTPPAKHDHIDFIFSNAVCLRFTDPRRFGAVLFTEAPWDEHELLKSIGPEPFDDRFNATYLRELARNKRIAIKTFIMDGKTVAGVGNIYATEALFAAKILPIRPANTLTLPEAKVLVREIRKVLEHAIKKGGTTLNDFMQADGKPGYFSIELKAYGRGGLPCVRCQTTLQTVRTNQRSTVYCPHCQPKSPI